MYDYRKKDERKQKHLKSHFTTELIRKQNRARLLDALESESKLWLSNPEFWKNHSEVAMPNAEKSQSDYYLKLQDVS